MIDVKKYKNSSGTSNPFYKFLVVFLFVIILFSLIGRFFSEIYNYIEIKEIGEKYLQVFFVNLTTEIIFQLIYFVVLFSIYFFSLLFFRMNLKSISIDSAIFSKKLLLALVSFLAALIFSGALSENIAEKFLLFSNSQPFDKTDPIFYKNIGYYVFQRPFLSEILSSIFSVYFSVSVIIFVLYFILIVIIGGYKFSDILKFKSCFVHNVFNLTVLIIMYALSYIFKAEDILFSSFGNLQGAGTTERVIWLSYYRIAPFILVFITVFSIYFIKKENFRKAIKTFLLFPIIWILTLVVSVAFQYIVVSPNEVVKEQENINNNIIYTKSAYNLNNIKEIEFNINNNLTVSDITENKNTLDNIRVIDLESNLTVLNQIQGIRNYYKFNETDIIPFRINGEKTAVAITPREITKENLSDTADTYINRKLRYTHGFGVAVNPINKVSSHGQPEFLIKDIPPKSAEGITQIKQPRIYYGELTNDYVIVGSPKYKELDYSEGQDDIEFTYDGKGGVNLTFLNRILFAARYSDFRLLVSDMFTSKSKILINRNIIDRLNKVVPFLEFDKDPYMIIDKNGNLKWIVDGYTKTSEYPYSQRINSVNYIRNSVKAIIDAYNGDIKLYICDKKDPVILAYNQMYPDIFEKEELSADIKEHIKYPETLFNIQSQIYAKYHVDNPTAFYNKNDMWVVANEKYGKENEVHQIAPYYNRMKLHGEEEGELLLTIPYTLANKDNMVSWLAVRNEWSKHGELFVYKFPKDINIYGPMQIENRINSDTEISSALTLWSQGGSKVIRGNMIVVPIKNSILYIEPLYMTSNNESNLPELKQVIVAYNEKIVMKNNLQEALSALFDGKQIIEQNLENHYNDAHEENNNITYDDAVNAVIDKFNAVKESSSKGDWEGFGRSMKELEESVNALQNTN